MQIEKRGSSYFANFGSFYTFGQNHADAIIKLLRLMKYEEFITMREVNKKYMTQEKTKELLTKLFNTGKRDNGEDFICFTDACFEGGTKLNNMYYTVKNVMRESGLTHEFSYQIASRAVDILAGLDDWENEDKRDDFLEAVDSAVPIYTDKIMEIYLSNSESVDEAEAELGGTNAEQRARNAWYMLIERMTSEIVTVLTK